MEINNKQHYILPKSIKGLLRNFKLTDRQREILNFIITYVCNNGRPPPLKEIGEEFSISSTNGVLEHIKALEKKGYVKRKRNCNSIKILRNASYNKVVYKLVEIDE